MLSRFLRLLILVAGGIIISQLASFAIIAIDGIDFSDATISNLPVNTLRFILALGHVLTFILPCIIFVYITYKDRKWEELKLDRFFSLELFVLCGIFFLVSYPAVTYSYTINAQLPLAEWMISQESATASTLEKILTMDHLGVFLINILLIAILPAIGEELLFRGLIMDFIEKSTLNGHLAVWISAAAFSLFHLQFQGFLPRLVLGAVLGYTFLFTRSLWMPIILHFFNNAAPIASLYFLNEELAAIDPNETAEIHWSLGLGSVLLAAAVAYYISIRTKVNEV